LFHLKRRLPFFSTHWGHVAPVGCDGSFIEEIAMTTEMGSSPHLKSHESVAHPIAARPDVPTGTRTSTRGAERRITDAQIEIVLAWHRNRRTFDDWARRFGVSRNTIRGALKTWRSPEQWHALHSTREGQGRKRMLSVAQLDMLVNWYRTRKTRRQLARELGFADGTIGQVIKRKGVYKRCTPDQRQAIQAERLEKLQSFEPRVWRRPPRDAQNRWTALRTENAARFRASLVFNHT